MHLSRTEARLDDQSLDPISARAKQRVRFDLQRPCKLLDVVQRDVPSASLYVSDKRSMESGFKGKVLLRPPFLTTHQQKIGSQHLAGAFATLARAAGGGRHKK